jgi:CDGSH-type Zn-finger protein
MDTETRPSPNGPKIEAGESYALCRCGQSCEQPFCDGRHVEE